MFLTRENSTLAVVLYSLSQFISVWILPFILEQMNKREITPFNMMKCTTLWKRWPLRKAADRFIWCTLFRGYFLFAFKKVPFKFAVADTECRSSNLNYDAA